MRSCRSTTRRRRRTPISASRTAPTRHSSASTIATRPRSSCRLASDGSGEEIKELSNLNSQLSTLIRIMLKASDAYSEHGDEFVRLLEQPIAKLLVTKRLRFGDTEPVLRLVAFLERDGSFCREFAAAVGRS